METVRHRYKTLCWLKRTEKNLAFATKQKFVAFFVCKLSKIEMNVSLCNYLLD